MDPGVAYCHFMGGNLFKLGRLPRAQYLVIEADVRRFLDDLLPDGYRIPRYYGSKPDFGDLDVVIDQGAVEALGGADAFQTAVTDGLGTSRAMNTGHVYATVYRDFQVDYFMRPSDRFEATYNYLSFNDLGNILGKIAKRLGLKYGEEGLSFVFRRESQTSYKKEHLVSRDWSRILAFLGLDLGPWQRGFETLEEMFGWVVGSPWFSVAPYLDGDKAIERRTALRTTMARFVQWLEETGADQRPTFLADRSGYAPRIDLAFPEAGLTHWLNAERAREAEAVALRAKFSGDLVRTWTGLQGRALGEFIRRFRSQYGDEALLEMSAERIQDLVERFEPDLMSMDRK